MSVQGQERLEQVPPQPHAQSLREPPHAHGAPFLKFRQRANPTSANTIARITIEAAFIIDQLSQSSNPPIPLLPPHRTDNHPQAPEIKQNRDGCPETEPAARNQHPDLIDRERERVADEQLEGDREPAPRL